MSLDYSWFKTELKRGVNQRMRFSKGFPHKGRGEAYRTRFFWFLYQGLPKISNEWFFPRIQADLTRDYVIKLILSRYWIISSRIQSLEAWSSTIFPEIYLKKRLVIDFLKKVYFFLNKKVTTLACWCWKIIVPFSMLSQRLKSGNIGSRRLFVPSPVFPGRGSTRFFMRMFSWVSSTRIS